MSEPARTRPALACGFDRPCICVPLLRRAMLCSCLVRSISESKCEGLFQTELGATVARRKQSDRAPERAADGGSDVVRPPDAHARLAEPLACGCGELVRVLAELAPVAHRLLEVVADERVVAGAVAVEPDGRAFVQVGAVGFGQARVGGVAEEDVVEGVAVVARVGGRGGVDEAGAREREQVAGDLAVGERGDGAEGELASDDGSALEHRPLGRIEPAESACEHRLERRRQPFAAFGRVRRELLDVERSCPSASSTIRFACLLVELGGAGDELARVARRPAGRARAARRASRSSSGRARQRTSSGASSFARRGSRPGRAGGLGPVHVVEDRAAPAASASRPPAGVARPSTTRPSDAVCVPAGERGKPVAGRARRPARRRALARARCGAARRGAGGTCRSLAVARRSARRAPPVSPAFAERELAGEACLADSRVRRRR